MASDWKIREYLLNCTSSIANVKETTTIIPADLPTRSNSDEYWAERRRLLAATQPYQFTLPPDGIMQVLVDMVAAIPSVSHNQIATPQATC